ncbi:glutathione S-transferase U22-like [Silene latifolia]|uniref:glutathione S-transferase U22-like n=1 Tax=Silene latifolia TaxID=37657 RepID=UPI003D7821A7
MASEVVLLDFWPSPFGMRARLALAEKGVTYEYKEEDLSNKSELLLQMNPVHKKIPVLVHNNKPVSESLNVVEYIDEVWNNNNLLLPSDPYQRAQARFWADYVDTKLFESANRLWKTKGAEQEEAKKDFIERLKVMEEQLGDNPYFGGDTFGFVDVAFFPFYPWFYAFEIAGNFKVEELCPNIIEWAKRCLLRDSVKTLPDQNQVYEFYLKLKKMLGID